MPNTGKPSGGCHACRRKKVKCDQQRPTCSRCERAGQTCPGYRDDPSIFRSMNESSETRALHPRPRRKRSDQASNPDSSFSEAEPSRPAVARETSGGNRSRSPTNEVAVNSFQGQWRERTTLSPKISTNWEDQAVCFYFSEWTLRPHEHFGTPGYLEFLPDLINEDAHLTYLTEALKAVSLGAMGNRSSMAQLKEEARRSYGRALAQVGVALNDEKQAKSDAALATVLLLGQYEIISADKPAGQLWQSHGKGQAALLKLRGPDQFKTARGRSLFRIAQASMQLIDIGGSEGTKYAFSTDEYPENTYQTPLGHNMGDLRRQIAGVRGEAQSLRLESVRSMGWHTRALDLIVRCSTIARHIEEWRDWSPIPYQPWIAPGLHPIEVSPSTLEPPGMLLPTQIYLFQTLSCAGIWANFWCTRLKLLETMIDLADALRDARFALTADLDGFGLRSKLLACVDDILACVPYLLGELDVAGALGVGSHGKSIGAYYLLWPLHVASAATQDILPERFWWIIERLTQIGNMYGVKQAHLLRDHTLAHPRVRPTWQGGFADEAMSTV